MILGLLGMWTGRQQWHEHLIFYALIATFGAVTAVFYGHTNYRVYLDVYLIVFAASILERFWIRSLSYGGPSVLDFIKKSARVVI